MNGYNELFLSIDDNYKLSEDVYNDSLSIFTDIFRFCCKDRYTVAESLLYHLENYGVPVWYDRHDLIIGDNRQKENFEKGIIESKYAIIIFQKIQKIAFV